MGGGRSLIVLLVSVFVLSVAGLGGQDNHIATIHVINSMPKDSEPMQIHCKSSNTDYGMQQVRVGDDYQCGVREKALYFCAALSGRQIASFHGFQPRRDGNHKAVFWLVKEDGFFLSWDKSKWVKKSEWYTD
ncbi:hypothetical protein PTKIN_Ptkin17bG0057800 [Pterospermum kingtungense]